MEGGEAGGDIVTLAALRVNVVLLGELLWVGSVAPADLQACTWPLLKAMFGAPADTSGFFSLTHDDDGLTLIMDERCNTAFADAAPLAPVSYAPHRWRAFEIHLGSVAAEVPSIICFLSSIMAENHISILNLSTYHRDFLLVRESQVREAIAVLRDSLQHDCTEGLQEAMTELDVRRSIGNGAFLNPHDLDDEVGGKEPGNPTNDAPRGAPTPNGGARAAPSNGEGLVGGKGVPPASFGAASSGAALARLGSTSSAEVEGEELYIKVLAARLNVVRIQVGMLPPCTNALLKRLLFSDDAAEGGGGFWSYTHTESDVSLIIDQRELAEFPPGAVLGEPTCWRAVKLCGRRFEFDETGVVSAMFAPHKERVPMLNVSTFSNNLTLVEDENLDRRDRPRLHDMARSSEMSR